MSGFSAPASKAGRLQRAALAILEQKHADGVLPTNGRFVFYELEHTGLVRKSKPGEGRRLRGFPAGSQDLGDALFYLRDKGIISWAWIEDETRTLTEWNHAPSVASYLRDRVAEATINPWEPEPPPLILVESRSLSGVLRSTASDYCCPIAATNGQAGGFLRTDVAPLRGGPANPVPRRPRPPGRPNRAEHSPRSGTRPRLRPRLAAARADAGAGRQLRVGGDLETRRALPTGPRAVRLGGGGPRPTETDGARTRRARASATPTARARSGTREPRARRMAPCSGPEWDRAVRVREAA